MKINRWILVLVGFAALAVSFSVRAVLGLAMPVIERDVGWTRSFLSDVGALALLVMAFAAPIAGRIIDQHGPRLLMSGGMLAIALGAGLVSLSHSSIIFAIGFGLVAAIGFTAVATNVVASAIARSFDERRGLATGIGTSGATGGQLIVVPIVAVLMQSASWRLGFSALAICALTLAVAAYALLPSENGEAAVRQSSMLSGVGALIRAPAFHILFWSFLICGFTTTGVIETHLLPYASFCGFPPLPSASAYGVLSAVNLAGMVLAGYLVDRVHRPLLLASIYLIRAGSFVLLLHVAPDIRLLYVFVVLFGLVDYSTVPVTVGLAASHFGIERIGLAMGLISGGHALGGALGALAGGMLFDMTGAYGFLWTGSVAVSVVAALLVLTLGNKPDQREAGAATVVVGHQG
ncbi:MFS transporter [Chelatococcus asaccharovorans]|uniref:Sugar phosphate permease n=1 Tax=Chelatococcus asaccharovorans TaxID=28210 RepID=A0A2V3UF51_9HYPH|nr:MFS transporter [Chelatococcus asaccharovorans]MBS7702972.1 MFS transporter [Chelatococcus asaccharovorans]PXW57270.1 sugar phosphate permease [Chelatococcus asaccharovorans]